MQIGLKISSGGLTRIAAASFPLCRSRRLLNSIQWDHEKRCGNCSCRSHDARRGGVRMMRGASFILLAAGFFHECGAGFNRNVFRSAILPSGTRRNDGAGGERSLTAFAEAQSLRNHWRKDGAGLLCGAIIISSQHADFGDRTKIACDPTGHTGPATRNWNSRGYAVKIFLIAILTMLAGCSDLGTTGMWGANGMNNSGAELGTRGIWSTSDSGVAHDQRAQTTIK